MAAGDAKWRHVESRLAGWAAGLIEGLSVEEQRRAWLAGTALLRRPRREPISAPPLTVESAFEAAVQRLRAARAGDELAAQALERMVLEGYLADREESLAGFTADLDASTRQEVAALACFAHRQRGLPPPEAIMQALRLAYDRTHHPDPVLRGESARTLEAVLAQVEATPVLRLAVASFVAEHLRTLGGLVDWPPR
jgi:hypothetical protein